jgi:DNA mismatch repair protein MutS
MSFVTDKQTLTDLNLTGKYKEGSMLTLFNRVKTRGGELLMEDMFRAPLTTANAINDRVAKIKYIQQLNLQLCINRDLIEMASQYLTENRPFNQLSSVFQAYKEKTQEVVYRSEKYYLHQKNIHAVQELLHAASNLLGQLKKKGTPQNPCSKMEERLDKIVNAPSLKSLRPKYPYTVAQMAHCHYLFLNKYREGLEELLKLVYLFDVFISVAYVATHNGLTYAQAHDNQGDKLIEVKNMRHPSLSDAVGNLITLSKNENVLFLTGANMAGKSTWMKTLGVSF